MQHLSSGSAFSLVSGRVGGGAAGLNGGAGGGPGAPPAGGYAGAMTTGSDLQRLQSQSPPNASASSSPPIPSLIPSLISKFPKSKTSKAKVKPRSKAATARHLGGGGKAGSGVTAAGGGSAAAAAAASASVAKYSASKGAGAGAIGTAVEPKISATASFTQKMEAGLPLPMAAGVPSFPLSAAEPAKGKGGGGGGGSAAPKAPNKKKRKTPTPSTTSAPTTAAATTAAANPKKRKRPSDAGATDVNGATAGRAATNASSGAGGGAAAVAVAAVASDDEGDIHCAIPNGELEVSGHLAVVSTCEHIHCSLSRNPLSTSFLSVLCDAWRRKIMPSIKAELQRCSVCSSLPERETWLGEEEDLLTCLHCSAQCCRRESHIQEHFILSGHTFAVSAESEELYCFACGDFIYDVGFDLVKEKAREECGIALGMRDEQRKGLLAKNPTFALVGGNRIISSGDGNNGKSKNGIRAAGKSSSSSSLAPSLLEKENLAQAFEKVISSNGGAAESDGGSSSNNTSASDKYYHSTAAAAASAGPRLDKARATVAELGLFGMYNMGNACFMSAILQAILHTELVRSFFLSGGHCFETCEAIRSQVSKKVSEMKDILKSEEEGGGGDSKKKEGVEQQTLLNFDKFSENLAEGRNRSGSPWEEPITSASNGTDTSSSSYCVACEVSRLFWAWYGPPDGQRHLTFQSILPRAPHQLMSAIWSSTKSLAGYKQQDAHEFFIALLDNIHLHLAVFEDNQKRVARLDGAIQKVRERKALADRVASSSAKRKPASAAALATTKMSIAEFYKVHNIDPEDLNLDGPLVSKRHGSMAVHVAKTVRALHIEGFIGEAFAGVTKSDLTCLSCKHVSCTYERFLEVGLSLHGDTLDSCLQNFIKTETLGGASSGMTCDSCAERSVTKSKRLSFSVLPVNLALQLKRFSALHDSKIANHISFPLVNLDMGTYLSGFVDESRPNDRSAVPPRVIYDLYAVVCHTGNTGSMGHYISYIRERNAPGWVKCDDAMVTWVSEQEVEDCQAYMLFYTKRDSVRSWTNLQQLATASKNFAPASQNY